MTFDPHLDFAASLDAADELSRFRKQFAIPVDQRGEPCVYFAGNSLGLQPTAAANQVQQVLIDWNQRGVEGHFAGKQPWVNYHQQLAPNLARIVGASEREVVAMNSLTVNLHLMMVSFYRPNRSRTKILIERGAFPSDHYAVESQLRWFNLEPRQHLIEVSADDGAPTLSTETILDAIERDHTRIALVLLPGVQYFTGQVMDIATISAVCKGYGIACGWDLAHSVGNVPVDLTAADPDFAVWCGYKYLNGGPGCIGGCFVNRRHVDRFDLPRLNGWWGHEPETRFQMTNQFEPTASADGWQLSNPSILSAAALYGSLKVFESAGFMPPLHQKAIRMTEYFRNLLRHVVGDRIEIVTPHDPARTGCQLSLRLSEMVSKRTKWKSAGELTAALRAEGLIVDHREPDVIRAAPVPLYNQFVEIHRFVDHLSRLLGV